MLFLGDGPALGVMGESVAGGLPEAPGIREPIGGSATDRHIIL